MKSSLEKQDNTEEEKRKTEEMIRIEEKRGRAEEQEMFDDLLDAIPYKDMTALHVAAVKGNVEMVRLLLLHPAIHVNAVSSKYGWTALKDSSTEDIKALLRAKGAI
eukprot:scaffold549_cov174-Ochromonas_danica.AAC.11